MRQVGHAAMAGPRHDASAALPRPSSPWASVRNEGGAAGKLLLHQMALERVLRGSHAGVVFLVVVR